MKQSEMKKKKDGRFHSVTTEKESRRYHRCRRRRRGPGPFLKGTDV